MTADAGSYRLLGDTDAHMHTCLYHQHLCTNSHVDPAPLRAAWVPAAPCGSVDWHFLDDKDGSDSQQSTFKSHNVASSVTSVTTDPQGAQIMSVHTRRGPRCSQYAQLVHRMLFWDPDYEFPQVDYLDLRLLFPRYFVFYVSDFQRQ